VIAESEEHPEKQNWGRALTEEGMQMDTSRLHRPKAPMRMDESPEPNSKATVLSDEHPLKQ
jgi:hypothetical protein